ncbi:Beta-lactamase-like protein [Akanthomyces lecanii RCEF 1005]|uniref:Beta-lactamase-like protein n=1 Tax=Akanthomyces lecanii RCEF 1005 TaxID=1081108 RepID=A0A168FAW0_CORDF|nr:Beta-lactamase-like protein [Akanthomyces lecanii RCEF 1005]
MSDLRSAVYVAPPIPLQAADPAAKGGVWSPISCTLIYTSKEAVLVDTPITIQQTNVLIAWIEKIAPKRSLTHIYITHGHGDHFFGIPLILNRFPEAVPVATPAVIRHMEQQIEEQVFSTMWRSRFPGQIYEPQSTASIKPLPEDNRFLIDRRYELQAIEVGHSDTHDSTILWVPDLKLAVCGDVVYGQVHQMLYEANTQAKREAWIKAIGIVEDLKPSYVVAGHRQAEEIDGVWHLAATRKYIEDFGKALAKNPKDAKELFNEMVKLYPDRFNPAALKMGCIGAFLIPKEARL